MSNESRKQQVNTDLMACATGDDTGNTQYDQEAVESQKDVGQAAANDDDDDDEE